MRGDDDDPGNNPRTSATSAVPVVTCGVQFRSQSKPKPPDPVGDAYGSNSFASVVRSPRESTTFVVNCEADMSEPRFKLIPLAASKYGKFEPGERF